MSRDDYLAKIPEVTVVPEDVSVTALGDYIEGRGPMPEGAYGTTFEQFSAQGRVDDCDCQLVPCVCSQARQHGKNCPLRQALTCGFAFNCERHGLEVCAQCDACTCGTSNEQT